MPGALAAEIAIAGRLLAAHYNREKHTYRGLILALL